MVLDRAGNLFNDFRWPMLGRLAEDGFQAAELEERSLFIDGFDQAVGVEQQRLAGEEGLSCFAVEGGRVDAEGKLADLFEAGDFAGGVVVDQWRVVAGAAPGERSGGGVEECQESG